MDVLLDDVAIERILYDCFYSLVVVDLEKDNLAQHEDGYADDWEQNQ